LSAIVASRFLGSIYKVGSHLILLAGSGRNQVYINQRKKKPDPFAPDDRQEPLESLIGK
jgi:hypothetical protein